ncbi:hypothetical protein LCGC14_2065710 [marine sediment metagenome]|uniref:Uncharacterized protein n=1 Tax=marine sediment metagenome TaxID=412755 RepID=A0A0F9EK15_9ZZZZ|nr:hypothetical protein [Phycisphaerales bacterium]
MIDNNNIVAINRVIQAYFDTHPNEAKVPAKDLMPQFIVAGIFHSDHRNGLPIRKVLRELDSKKQLKFIPSVLPERKPKNTYWFFDRDLVG